MSEMDAAQKPSDLQFFALPIWARIYNVPFRGRYNESNARVMGDKIGEYMEMDKIYSLGMKKSLYIRVCLDVKTSEKTRYDQSPRRGIMHMFGEIRKTPAHSFLQS